MALAATSRSTTLGPLRGSCGHKHKDLESAVGCWAKDEAVCAARGGHTDRQIFAVERGGRRELNAPEQAMVERYRAGRGF
jgi:hypothetical protein